MAMAENESPDLIVYCLLVQEKPEQIGTLRAWLTEMKLGFVTCGLAFSRAARVMLNLLEMRVRLSIGRTT